MDLIDGIPCILYSLDSEAVDQRSAAIGNPISGLQMIDSRLNQYAQPSRARVHAILHVLYGSALSLSRARSLPLSYMS